MSLLKPCDLFSCCGKRSVSGRSRSEGWSVPAWVHARGSGRAAPAAPLPSRPSCVSPQSRALSALPCPSWRLLLLRCVWGLWSSALFFLLFFFFNAEMLRVSLVLGELVSPKGGSAGRYKTCHILSVSSLEKGGLGFGGVCCEPVLLG